MGPFRSVDVGREGGFCAGTCVLKERLGPILLAVASNLEA